MRTGSWKTFPEVLQAAGVSWKIYQDLAGATFAPDFGDGTGNSFAGNFTDNSLLYFNQYATAAPGSPLFDKALYGHRDHQYHSERIGTRVRPGRPGPSSLFDEFRSDVQSGKLPQVSWIVGAGRLYRTLRIGRSTTAPGTSPRSSTSWCPTPRCSARPSSSSTTTRPTAASTTSCRRHRRRHPRTGRRRSASKTKSSRTVDPERPDRPRHACAVPCDLALEQGRLRQFPGLRSHVGDPVHREAFRSLRAQHLPVAPCGGG